jgi:hypothetical protein
MLPLRSFRHFIGLPIRAMLVPTGFAADAYRIPNMRNQWAKVDKLQYSNLQ